MYFKCNNDKSKRQKDFLSMLLDMARNENDDCQNCSINISFDTITVSELTYQICQALLDIFNAEIIEEENYVIKMKFPNDETFKLIISKDNISLSE